MTGTTDRIGPAAQLSMARQKLVAELDKAQQAKANLEGPAPTRGGRKANGAEKKRGRPRKIVSGEADDKRGLDAAFAAADE